jgi:hypothetical protein
MHQKMISRSTHTDETMEFRGMEELKDSRFLERYTLWHLYGVFTCQVMSLLVVKSVL